MADVALESLSKTYRGGTVAVSDIDLTIADGELLVLVGPSGCGKSTLLRMVAGLETETAGTIRIGDRIVNDLSPAKRDIAMVFQNYALYPHMTARRNMELALKLQHVPKPERRRRVEEAATVLGLNELLDRRPAHLSGGQRQRVAMGRAIVRQPAVFLLDEPLSNLDAKLRAQVRTEISELQDRLGTTMIFVTHDQVEAMTMADRVAVLRHGRLQQVAEAQVLYDRPANLFVADFIGSPAMNLVTGSLDRSGDGPVVRVGGSRSAFPVTSEFVRRFGGHHGHELILGIRPERLELTPQPGPGQFAGTVRLVETLGGESLIHVEVDAPPVVTDETLEVAGDVHTGDLQTLVSERARFVSKVDGGSPLRTGDRVGVAPAVTAYVHAFDPVTSLAILADTRVAPHSGAT